MGLDLCDADHQEIKENVIKIIKNIHEKEIHLLDISYLKTLMVLVIPIIEVKKTRPYPFDTLNS
jgi:hypothetical protein